MNIRVTIAALWLLISAVFTVSAGDIAVVVRLDTPADDLYYFREPPPTPPPLPPAVVRVTPR